MINIVYYGAGTYTDGTGSARYSVVLPRLDNGSYEFPGIYNFSKNGVDRVLIHMQIKDITPDTDLSEDLSNLILHDISFNLKSLHSDSPSSNISLTGDVEIILCHDDEFNLQKEIERYYDTEMLNEKADDKTVPKRVGYGTLKIKL
ncbi:hypothetical protein [Flavobacterium sp.]|uniref:hypothetical protein n=1 Tax=Flavobacterium sp. TaxID=239 RepID=UPI00261D18E0|nr:hypothetical protein [Flavobacterium sp.]